MAGRLARKLSRKRRHAGRMPWLVDKYKSDCSKTSDARLEKCLKAGV